MSNERKADLPPHCGKCVHLDWDDDHCYCTHYCQVPIEERACEIPDLVRGGKTAEEIADVWSDDALADQGWHAYGNICDYWEASECHAATVTAEARARAALVSIIEAMIEEAKAKEAQK